MKRTLLIGLSILVILLGLPPVQHDKAAVQRALITPDNAAQVGEIMELGRGNPRSIVWSPDGKWLAIGTTTGVWLHNVADLTALPTRTRDMASTVFFSTDSRYLVMGDQNAVVIWGLSQSVSILTVQSAAAPITVLLNNKQYDLSLGNHYLRPGAAADVQRFIASHAFGVANGTSQILISPDERHLLYTADEDSNTSQLWDIATDQKVADFDTNSQHFSWSPDGLFLYNAFPVTNTDTHSHASIFNTADGAPIFNDPTSNDCVVVAWSPDNEKFARYCTFDSHGPILSVFNATTGKVIRTRTDLNKTVNFANATLALSTNGHFLVYIDSQDPHTKIVRWNFDTNNTEMVVGSDAAPPVYASEMHLQPGDQHIAVLSNDNLVRVYNTSTGKRDASLRYTTYQYSLIFAPDNQRLYSGSSLASMDTGDDLAIFAWDLASGQSLAEMNKQQPYVELDVSGNGKYLLSTDYNAADPTAVLWDLKTFKPIETLSDTYAQLLFAPGGNYYARMALPTPGIRSPFSTREFSTVTDASQMRPTGLISRPTASSNNGKLDLIGRDVYNHDQLVATIGSRSLSGLNSAFSPDDSHFAVVDFSPYVKLWNVQTLSVQAQWQIPAVGVAFSPDGRILAAAGFNQLTFIDVERRSIIVRLTVRSNVTCMAFSADGTMIATGNDQGSIQIWGIKGS